LIQVKADFSENIMMAPKGEAHMPLMPIETIYAVSAIVIAFAIFGIVLAWADQQTKNLPSRNNGARNDQRPQTVIAQKKNDTRRAA
jgi:hypothetical protein